METEDAWDIASHRASIISRKASNHSLLVPVPDTPSAAMAEAPTAINSEPEAPSSDHMAALSLHDRQVTAVAPEDIDNGGIPIASTTNHTTSFSQAATPMNETFLSTLAPGMSQRFDLAEEGSSQGHGSGNVSDRVPETLEEESDSAPDERSRDGSDELIFS